MTNGREHNTQACGGFSLLELLIVVAIILIVSTIAIPSLLRSRQASNEASAVSNMRTLNTAEVTYSSSMGHYTDMNGLIAAGLVDNRYNSTMSNYRYAITLSANQFDYTATATAISSDTGRYDYYTTPDFVIRYSTVTMRAPLGVEGEPVR